MKDKPRRTHGTGSLYAYEGVGGAETWYGRWYQGKKRLQRRIGPKRQPGKKDGLTRTEAEAKLRHMMVTAGTPVQRSDLTVADAAEDLLAHLELRGRKPTTLSTYRSSLRTHLLPLIGDSMLDLVRRHDIEQLDRAMQRRGSSPKTG